MRSTFAIELYNRMLENTNIYLLCGDLGYKMMDAIRMDFPERYVNCGASEQAMMDIACGIASEGKICFTYTITPFYLRAFETLRTYIDHENIPVKMIASGVGRSYLHDGFSHWADDIPDIMNIYKNIKQYYPNTKDEIQSLVKEVIFNNKPCFIVLQR